MLALILGSVLAVLALIYVLTPLLRGSIAAPPESYAPELPPESSALDALREIEFDQATGKLSDEDYAALKATYTPKAIAEMRALDGAQAIASTAAQSNAENSDDPAEELIRRAKANRPLGGAVVTCVTCGPRPESDAAFCSECGRALSAPAAR
jgi:hypothetical protein